MPESEQIFTNFYSLGCRFTGFIGPMDNSYYDPDIAVQHAVAAGCRTFVLEIDFLEDCDTKVPTLVVRDKQGKLMVQSDSTRPTCNSNIETSSINTTCKAINTYAFAESCQNNTDPVVLVLYFLRLPGSYNSQTTLDYFSNVAKMIAPLSTHFLGSEPSGVYYHQSQEGQLLINKMKDYKNKVLVFSNANTSGFRERIKSYDSKEDLDYLVNLRLSYTQTKMGETDNTSGSTFGILESTDDYMTIPSDRADKIISDTKLKWTMCLSKDPFQSVSEATYKKITATYGVHCVPIILYDIPANQYMFTDKLFKKYGFIPKPKALRYIKPPVVVPAEPSPTINANKGVLRKPTMG
jgi:hypothetical protein